MKNPYDYTEAEILAIADETQNIKTFTLKPRAEIGFRAGQFMDVTMPGIGEAPFTPSSNHNFKDKLDFTIMRAGRVTGLIHQAKVGDVVGVRGPYGLGYPLNEFKGKELFIVGGGVGLLCQNLLRDEHKSKDTTESIRLVVAMLITFSALVLGLIVNSAKADFDKRRADPKNTGTCDRAGRRSANASCSVQGVARWTAALRESLRT